MARRTRAIVDLQVASNPPSQFTEPLHESPVASAGLRAAGADRVERADARGRRALLRARSEGPRCRCAAEKRDERPALHSITSSAVICMIVGTVRPSALAVLRLITSSNLVA